VLAHGPRQIAPQLKAHVSWTREAMSRISAVGWAGWIAIVLCCCTPTTESTSLQSDLERAQAKWNEKVEGHDYAYVMQRSSFAGAPILAPVKIEVKNGEVVSMNYLHTGASVPKEYERHFLWTVPDLFEHVQEKLDEDADRLEVAYHPLWGYPILIHVRSPEGQFDKYRVIQVLMLNPGPGR